MNMQRLLGAVAIGAAATVALTGCGSDSGSSQGGGSTDVLRMAFSFDPGSLDPNVFYDGEGMTIVEAAYEGLVQYAADSTPTIEPVLAESYTVSDDRLTYTFTLRPDVKFHDGTAMTSQTWKAEFERRKAMKQGSAYLTADVASIQTPDPLTLVLKLSRPNSQFLHFLASPYGIRAVSPTAVRKHEKNGDHAAGWLANATAGTGPYMLRNVVPGQSYELAEFPDYWGDQPTYKTVQISMVPNFTNQQLQLRNGELDISTHGISPRDLTGFREPDFQVRALPVVVRLNMWLNPNVPPFSDPKVRAAMASALDRSAIVTQVYADTGDVAKQIFPLGALPDGVGMFEPPVDPAPLKALVPSLARKRVDLAFTTDDALNAQVAQLVQAQLAPTGLQVTTRGVTQQTTWSWPTKPDGRPNALILPANPDSTDPSSFAGLFYARTGGLSYFAPPNVARADALLQDGLYARSDAASKAAFAAAAKAYTASGNYIPLADLKAVFVARKGICGWENAHNFATLWAFRPQGLTAC